MARFLSFTVIAVMLAVPFVLDVAMPSARARTHGRWIDIGPAPLVGGQIGLIGHDRPVTGRASAVVINPQDNRHWLVGGAVGGVWETTDAGRSWTPLTDDQAALAVGAIAFAPGDPDVAYVGTGEALAGTSAFPGRGMLRLQRMAKHGPWTATLLESETPEAGRAADILENCANVAFSGLGFSAIAVHPVDPKHVLAATRYVGGRVDDTVDLHEADIPRDPCTRGIVRFQAGQWSVTPELRGDATDLVVHPAGASDAAYFDCMYVGLSRAKGVGPKPEDMAAIDDLNPVLGVYRRRTGACSAPEVDVESEPPFPRYPGNCVVRKTLTGLWNRISGPWDRLACDLFRARIPSKISEQYWLHNWDLLLARTRIAIARSNPDVVYVSISSQAVENPAKVSPTINSRLLGLWRTSNAWHARPRWIQIPVGATDGGSGAFGYCASNPPTGAQIQCHWNHVLSVDPNDPTIIYAGGVGLWRGKIKCERTRHDDPGVLADDCIRWVEVSRTLAPHPPTPRLRRIGTHVDQQALAWTADGRRLVIGNDGGIWSTTDAGRSWGAHNHGLSIMQFYRGAVADARDGSGPIMLGGTQDNGVARWRGGVWDWVLGGDGGTAVIANRNPDVRWAVTTTSVLFGNRLRRSLDGGKHFPFADDPLLIKTETNLETLMKPLAACPHNDDVMVIGASGEVPGGPKELWTATRQSLWKSTTFFRTATSPSWDRNFPKDNVVVTAVAFAAFDESCGTYAFGSLGAEGPPGKPGVVWLTTTGGRVWCEIGRWPAEERITGIAFDVKRRLYVSRVDIKSKTFGLIARTASAIPACGEDGAIALEWKNIPLVPHSLRHPGCFPDSIADGRRHREAAPCSAGTRPADEREHVNTIAIHPSEPDTIFAGTNSGLWVSDTAGDTWTRHDHKTYGMPNVPVLDIKISPREGHVVAFTYGRGAFLWQKDGWCNGKPSAVIGTNFRPCPK